MTFKEFAAKKIVGVPVLYLMGAAAIILAIVAYRMKTTSGEEMAPPDSGGVEDAEGSEVAADYSGLETQGTVTVVQQPATNPDPNPEIATNQTWVSKGTQWLVAERNINGSEAMSALTKYLQGQDRSYQEQEWVDLVFKQYGPPPDGREAEGGKVATKIATKQITPPGYHTVVGDEGYTVLAKLYYGNNALPYIDLLQAANADKGHAGPWAPGTKIFIPKYIDPVYFTVTSSTRTASQVASKNGITLQQLSLLNNPKGSNYNGNYSFAVGTKVRVK